MDKQRIGEQMHAWLRDLYPLCRSLTGDGVRKTLSYLQQKLPNLQIFSVPSGTQAFDWEVPKEWAIREAYILDEFGTRLIDFKSNNLHVVGYSESVDKWISLEELDKHLHSIPSQPDAIPYVTSYYERRWGFCMSHEQRKNLKPGKYRAVIDSDLTNGVMNYAEFILPGKVKEEVFLSTYVCHPSMANNELSGPVVALALARWLMDLEDLRYTYRIIFIPETIGSIYYLSRNLDHLKRFVKAGFNLTCIGDERCYSFLPSRSGSTLSDRAALHALKHIDPKFMRYSWLSRGSDERQYCSPGIDLPIASIMRSKYGEYPEYHTSLDDLNFVTPSGLMGGLNALQNAIKIIENNFTPKVKYSCEPQLGKRGLYPTISKKESIRKVKMMMDLVSYSDGEHDLLEIAELIGEPMDELLSIFRSLFEKGVITCSWD